MSDEDAGGTPAIEDESFVMAVADPDLSLDSLVEGRTLKAEFISNFGTWFDDQLRPLLRRVHGAGGEPQLLVNDLAALMQNIADSIYFPLDDGDDGDGDDGDGDGGDGDGDDGDDPAATGTD